MKNKVKGFELFITKLKNLESVDYRFEINWNWLEYHGRFEEKKNDWIEGVTERFIDGDDGRNWINFNWIFKREENKFYCYKESDLDESEIVFSGDEEDLKNIFEIE